MDFAGKNVLVYGTGLSGVSAAMLLLQKQAAVVLFDENEQLDRVAFYERTGLEERVELYLGELPPEVDERVELVVLSPGVPTDAPRVLSYKERGIPVWGEIELGYSCQRGRIFAITGTNGKTTTTTLLGEIMKMHYGDVRVVGNIGIPYAGTAQTTTDATVTVAEISSFQLETIHAFHPHVSAVLNITPDHLNRHHTMENYIAAKMDIAKNQTAEDVCVLNYDDEVLREEAKKLSCQVVWFSSLQVPPNGMYLQDDRIMYRDQQRKFELICVDDLNILGRHNHENAMAASLMALAGGVPLDKIRRALADFQAVEHRIEYVAEKRGVRFYNDSKATNPDAAIKGIQAMDRPTYLIAGGYDKQSEYEAWIESFGGRVKKLVLLGQTKEKIAAAAERLGFQNYVFADSLQQAVDICYEEAQNADAVLLSPACASWGMFPNYEVRGRMFKDMVHALKE